MKSAANDNRALLGEQIAPVIRLFLIHAGAIILCSTVVRAYLTFLIGPKLNGILFSIPVGLAFDLSVSIYTFFPFALLALLPNRLLLSLRFKSWVNAILFFDFSVFIFGACCEYVFYDEFKDRFNFIAVDYLVYTNEVLGNLWESYPILIIFTSVFGTAALAIWALNRLNVYPSGIEFNWRGRIAIIAIYIIAVATVSLSFSEQSILKKARPFEEIVSKNGLYSLFTAYRMNEIDYDRFYTGMDSKAAAEHVHELLEGSYEANEDHTNEDEDSIVRNIKASGELKRLNVILVVMESLSARYMEHFGNQDKLTPNLDRIIKHSLFFDRHYATGTRTVRGLEAILLSIPPTPGQSILRRPAGTNIFNLGQVFRENGYITNFTYGGRSAFDSMKSFFEGNHYSVVDQTDFSGDEITFSNAWGVCDEDLFDKVIEISDQHFENKKPFFNVVLTTSNHRPYTFPKGRVSRSSGSGRLAAIQYSDFAIGEFINSARNKPWFDSTVFIFVADHNAAVSGGTTILPDDYLVPLIVFSPSNVKGEINHKLSSQIDLAPTLLSLLSFSYQSRFFGMDLTTEDPKRAFLATYQKISYLNESSLTTLSPIQQVETAAWFDGKISEPSRVKIIRAEDAESEAVRTAVAYYKVASDWFRGKRLEAGVKFSNEVNPR